jgi:hypothetical protein
MEPSLLDKVQQRVAPYAKLVATTGISNGISNGAAGKAAGVGLWLGEGASAGHGGIDNVSNAFESGAESGGPFEPVLMYKRSTYQDWLGTTIGKSQK